MYEFIHPHHLCRDRSLSGQEPAEVVPLEGEAGDHVHGGLTHAPRVGGHLDQPLHLVAVGDAAWAVDRLP